MTSNAYDPAIDDLTIASNTGAGAVSAAMAGQAANVALGELAITARKEIVFIEDNVADLDTLVQGIGFGKEIIILDSNRDGVHQIAQALAGRSGIDALHVIAHGTEGAADFGALKLDSANAGAHSDDLQAIGRSLAAGGDILLYGCNIGAGEKGAGFLEQLAIATGADVVASNDLTGSAALGGDWELEVASGSIETPAVVNAHTAALYQQVLNIASANVNFNTPSNFIVTSEDTSNPNVNAIYKVNGNSGYQLVIDGQDLGTSAYAGSITPNPYVTAAPNGPDRSVTINFATGQIFTANSISIANFYVGTQNLVIKGYDAAGHQIGSAATPSLSYGASGYLPIAIPLSGMTGISSLKITATSNGNMVRYLLIDDLSLTNIQPPPPPPKVNSVSSPATNGTHKIGDVIDIGIIFDRAVDVTGTPQLTLETGTTDRVINYVSGSGGSTLVFRYTVQAGDSTADLDYLSTAALSLNGGTIKDHSSTSNANLLLPTPGTAGSLGAIKAIGIDGVAPTVSISSSASVLKAGESSVITFTFSEDPGASFTAADVHYSSGSLGAISGSGVTRTATFTPDANVNNGSATFSVTANSYADAAGNFGAGSSSAAITYDTLVPTLAITSNKATLTDGETATITFTFSEDPGASFTWNGSSGSIVVSGGTLSAISGSGVTRTATFTPTAGIDSGTASISVNAGQYLDARGNPGTAAATPSLTYDTLAPNAPSAPDLDPAFDSGASSTDHITSNTTLQFGGTTEVGVVTVKLYDGVTEIGSGAVSGNAYTITTAGTLANGVHTITAKGFDAAGNVSSASAGLAVTVDNVPPAVSISSTQSSLKAGETATITFTFTEDPGSSFSWDGTAGDVSVSGGTLSAISGTGPTRTATFTPDANVDAGTASITVTGAYADAAGNAGTAGATQSISFDTLAPNAPSVPDLAGGDDSGSSSTDNLTNDTTTSFSGTADAGTTVKLYDGATEIGSVTASGGAWTIPVAGLAKGSHTITAQAFDAAGNASAASSGLAVTVDRTPPSTTIASAGLSADTGASDTDMITSAGAQTISGTLSANLVAGEQVMVSIDNGATWTAATASAGMNTWEMAATFSGSDVLRVRVVDAAGNAEATYSHVYVVDTTPPAAPSTPDLDTASDSGSSHSDDVTSVTLPSFSGTAEVGATVRLFDGGIEIGSAVAADGTWHITTSSTTALGERTHFITAIATDLAGNSSTNSAALELVVKTSGPVTTIKTMALSTDSGTAGDFITNENSQTVSGTLSAALAAGERVQFSLDQGAHWTDAASAAGSDAWSFGAPLTAGPHDIQVRVLDAVDNSGPVRTQAYTLDSVKPAVTITSDAAQLKLGETATITFTFSEDPGTSFSWDGSSGDLTVSGGTLSAISGTGPVRTAVFTPAAASNGGTASITVTGAYEDAAGNSGTAGLTPSISFDTLAPSASSAPDLDSGSDKGSSDTDNLTNQTSLVFSGSAEAGAIVRLYDTNGSTEIGHGTAIGGTWTITTVALADGGHTVTAKVVDAAGNVSSVSGPTTVVIDTVKPTLVISSDVSQLKLGETATITFTFSEDPGSSFAWDGSSGDVTVSGGTLSAISGTGPVRTATFTPAAGTNGGTAGISVGAGKYLDAAGNDGNAGATPSLHFDTQAPAAPSAPDLTVGSDSGSSHSDNITADTTPTFSGTVETGATVTLYDGATAIGHVTSTDGTWTIEADQLGAGSHTITARAVDAAGNASAMSSGLAVQIITGGTATTIKTMVLSTDSGTAGDFITNENSQTVSGTLSAALAAGERVQFSLDQGAHWTDAASAAGSDAWSFGATLTAGPHDIQVRVLDAVDNSGPVRTQAYTLDSVKPAVTITSDAAQLKLGETATITFTFSEDPGTSFSWDGSSGDVTVSGGTLSAISGTGPVRTAVFTPAAASNGGTASITVTGAYEDAAGNSGTAGLTPSISFDTLAPGASSAPDLDKDSDSGVSDTDNLTHDTALVFSGSAEAGAIVRLYDTNGSTEIGHGTAIGGTWTITTAALADGDHTITAKVFDGAGNVSATSGPITVTVDATKPGALAAPVLASASDSGVKGDGITSTAAPVFSGTAEALAQVTLYDSDGTTAIGSVKADAAGAWQITAASLPDGVHAITARQVDAAGNESAAGAVFSLSVDTVAPAAPAAPTLKAASDTGTIGDGITENNLPVIEGTALANSLVTLYDSVGASTVKVGVALADAAGKWSIQTSGLGYGTHTLKASQQDAAGNESAASAAFSLRIEEPPAPADLIDGVAVSIQPISLPGGVMGSAVSIPIVSATRTETSGVPGVADIPLATSGQGANLLLAQVALGYGLSASGANVPVADAAALLIAAIKAATPSHGASDQGHLTGNGESFLAGLAAGGSLLVETVRPVSAAPAPNGVLTLSGPLPSAGQSTALVIDATGLGAGSTIALQQVNFAAVIGAANVVAGSSMVLSGDAASQHFTIVPGSAGAVFAGGGDDTLGLSQGTAAGTTLLHGGSASDVAAFSGARADYKLEFHNGYVLVSSNATPAAKAMVINVEQLQFSDASVTVQNSADMGTLAGIYQTVLGRQADVSGIEFWANGHQAGASWGAIALDIIRSSEHAASHEGFNGVGAHDISLLYTALFNRAPDAAGLAFWTDALVHGASLEQIATDFVQSVEMVGHQRAALDWDFIVG
jgi:predicted secreted protein